MSVWYGISPRHIQDTWYKRLMLINRVQCWSRLGPQSYSKLEFSFPGHFHTRNRERHVILTTAFKYWFYFTKLAVICIQSCPIQFGVKHGLFSKSTQFFLFNKFIHEEKDLESFLERRSKISDRDERCCFCCSVPIKESWGLDRDLFNFYARAIIMLLKRQLFSIMTAKKVM